MQSAVTERGQVSIPAELLKRYSLKTGDSVEWLDEGECIRMIPVRNSSISALRGHGRGGALSARLRAVRQEERSK